MLLLFLLHVTRLRLVSINTGLLLSDETTLRRIDTCARDQFTRFETVAMAITCITYPCTLNRSLNQMTGDQLAACQAVAVVQILYRL